MVPASTRSLKILAALVWYIGGFFLLQKGGSLLFEAEALHPGQKWPWFAFITGLFLGSVKARFLFNKSCRKNLIRIDGLHHPKIWQFYRPRFFVFLMLMILAGTTLSRLAHGKYPFLIGVAIVDFSISVALLGSSYIFWTHRSLLK
jgi:hypothetical protein